MLRFETGARYFAALAFPNASEDDARQEAAAAWVGSYLHEANRVDESTEPFADQRLNQFVALDPTWCKAKLRTAKRRLSDRSIAARAVRPWMRELLDLSQPLVPGTTKFTQRQIALFLCDGNLDRVKKFQERVWRPARPVMHVTVATDLLTLGLCR